MPLLLMTTAERRFLYWLVIGSDISHGWVTANNRNFVHSEQFTRSLQPCEATVGSSIHSGRCWSVGPDQIRVPQRGPELGRDLLDHEVDVLLHVMRVARSGEHSRDRGMRQNELQRRRLQRNIELFANLFDPHDAIDDRLRCGTIVIMRAGYRARSENAAIVAAAECDRDVALHAQREKRIQRVLFEQRIAAGKKKTVEIPLLQSLLANRP